MELVLSQNDFGAPKVSITRVYTRGGDEGQTSLVGGRRVDKDDGRIAAYGTIDELNACLGLARTSAESSSPACPALADLAHIFLRIQHELFNLGSILATPAEDVHPSQPRVRDVEVERLEREIDRYNAELPSLRSFVLPGGSRLGAELHLCRTVCRRAERLCVALARTVPLDGAILRYVNRLSDALFVWSRWADRAQGQQETLWDPNIANPDERRE